MRTLISLVIAFTLVNTAWAHTQPDASDSSVQHFLEVEKILEQSQQ